nr:hypothetical protein [Leuconostoc mesenteroides]
MNKLLAEYQDTEHIDNFALIKAAEVRLTKTGKTYISILFSDRSGDLPGNLWDATDEQIKTLILGKLLAYKALGIIS